MAVVVRALVVVVLDQEKNIESFFEKIVVRMKKGCTFVASIKKQFFCCGMVETDILKALTLFFGV